MRLQTEAFILHRRNYSNSSYLLDILTAEGSVKRLLFRGGRKKAQTIQLFCVYWIDYVSKDGLSYIYDMELLKSKHLLGKALYCGLYINELLVKLCPFNMDEPDIYHTYLYTLSQLSLNQNFDETLRNFELLLIASIGYGLSFDKDIQGENIDANQSYRFIMHSGFSRAEECDDRVSICFTGAQLQKIHQRDFKEQTTKSAAKYLLRYVISELLAHKPLISRQLFKEVY